MPSEKRQTLIFEGWISIRSALLAKSRDIKEIKIQRDKLNKRNQSLLNRAKKAGVKISYVDSKEISKLAKGKTHGGIIAIVTKRKLVAIEDIGLGSSPSFIAMLDGIEDPFNLGQAIRSLYAAGVHAIVLRKRNWDFAESIIAKSSAGASEFVAMAMVNSALEAAEIFKKRAFNIAYTGIEKESISVYEANFKQPLFILIGGEKRGINKNLKDVADMIIRIPYGRNFGQALDASSSTAIIAFEVLRQRRFQK